MRSTLLLLFVSLLAAPTPAADTSTPAADPHAADPQTWPRSLATQVGSRPQFQFPRSDDEFPTCRPCALFECPG